MDESSAAKEPQAASEQVGLAKRATPSLIAERYRVLRVLGEGSTGIVYLCEHTALQKEVAVKVLHRDLANNAGLVARFTREAQTAARLDHPSSVHVMDFGQDRDGTLYLVMEYVDGRDLSQLLDDLGHSETEKLDDERIVHIMSCILSALSAAHALGIVHRDLKPENVLIRTDPSSPEADIVKVCDFGVAQFSPVRMAHNNNHTRSTETRRVTGDGMLVGTPWYMSPEQARAETLDARSDIYSAGVVLFQLLTRTLPFLGDDVMAVALMHCTTPPPPPSGFAAVHPGLEAVCLRALSKTREARYQTANEMLTALRAAVAMQIPGRTLARISKPPSPLTVSPLAAAYPTLPGTATSTGTPMGTPTVKQPQTIRRRKGLPSLLVAGVATTVLGLGALLAAPRVLPPQTIAGLVPSALHGVLGVRPQPKPARVRIQNDPDLQRMAAAPGLPVPVTLPDAVPVAPAPEAVAQAKPTPPPAAAPRARKVRPAAPVTPVVQAATAEVPVSEPAPGSDGAHEAGASGSDAPAPAAAVQEGAAAAASRAEEKPVPAPAPAPVAPPKPQPTAAAAPKIARVDVSADRLPPGISRVSIRSALSQASLVNCYAQAQQRAPQLVLSGTALELKTNTSGRIVWAHVGNGALPAPLRECLEQVARSGFIRTGEGGEVNATLNLAPSP